MERGFPLEPLRRDKPIEQGTAARSAAETHEPLSDIVHGELEDKDRGLPSRYLSFDCAHS